MKQSIILTSNKGKSIGVLSNTFERAAYHYLHDLDYIGFDNWLLKGRLKLQTDLYKDCDHMIEFSHWHEDLQKKQLWVDDVSQLESRKYISDYKRWYTIKSINLVSEMFREELLKYGYRY